MYSSNKKVFFHNTHPNSGAAVKCKGFDLSIFQKHLQHIWYQKQRVVFKHGLKKKKKTGEKEGRNSQWTLDEILRKEKTELINTENQIKKSNIF